MNKKERAKLISKLKASTWYYFCMAEARWPKELEMSKSQMAVELGVSVASLEKYLKVWEGYGLVKTRPGGFELAQLDGTESGIKEEIKPRRFTTAKSVLDYWCDIYFNHYHEQYAITNWGMAQAQAKKLLVYTDEEIEATIYVAITQYERRWFTNPKYPRPTLGALASWLFRQAMPYAEKPAPAQSTVTTEYDDDAELAAMKEKGWL